MTADAKPLAMLDGISLVSKVSIKKEWYSLAMSSNVNISVDEEQRIVETMVLMYCSAHHGKEDAPCAECSQLIEYSQVRSERCPQRPDKPFCSACATHCYEPEMRERIREVMRYSGPRMIYKHPLMAISHMRNGMRR